MAEEKKGPEEKDEGSTRSIREDSGAQPARYPESSPNLAGQNLEGLIQELREHQVELETQAEELSRAHLALGELRDRYLDLYEFAPIGYFTLTGNALITDANLTGAVLLGVERNNLVNARFSEFIAKKDSGPWYQYFMDVLDQGEKQACTAMIRRGDGSTFPARLESIRIAGSDGAIVVRVAISDISDIRRVEEALKERLKELNCLYGISALLELPGISLDEILGKTVLLLPLAWQFPEITEASIVLEGRAFQTVNFRETSWMQACEIIVNGIPSGQVVVCYLEERQGSGEGPFLQDEQKLLDAITERLGHIIERKRAEGALAGSEEKIRLLLNSAAEAIYGLDMNGNCTFCNASCLRQLGYKHQDELLGRNMHWQIHAKHPDGTPYPVEECPIFRAFNKGEGTHVDDEVLWRADGTSFPAEYWSYPQRHHDVVVGAVVTFMDITERKELENEREYHEQELMRFSTALTTANRKLNLLSSITRHDINNQLTVQMGYLEILEDMPPGPSRDEYFQKVLTAAERISAMIRFTREYEQIGVSTPAWQDCRSLVDTAAKEAPLGKVIVKNDVPAGMEMFADPLVVKVFYNLMDNAVRYGGKITFIRFSGMEHVGSHAVVCEDDGDGVVVDEKVKIFDRGFGKNTGLGLALSREILDITGITIKETGEPGQGARFELTLPKDAWRIMGVGNE